MLPPHDSVEAMAVAYAEEAVKTALTLNTKLDYGEDSLAQLDRVLDQVTSPAEGDEMTEACKMWGSYLGEVVRRRFGGMWSIETYPGKDFATLTLTVDGAKLFPSMKIHRRFTRGSDDNLWDFYKMVKSRLASVPGDRIQ